MIFKSEGIMEPANTRVKRILCMVLPVFLSMLLSNASSIVDMVMVSRANTDFVAAIGIAVQPILIMQVLFEAFNVGSGALISMAKGKSDRKAAKGVLQTTFVLMLGSAAAVTLVALAAKRLLLSVVMGAEYGSSLYQYASQYYLVCMLGLVVYALMSSVSKALLSVGENKRALLISAVGLAVNSILNYGMIYGRLGFPVMGIWGAAVSTVIGYCVTLALGLYLLYRPRYHSYLCMQGEPMLRFRSESARQICAIGLPTIFERVFVRFGMLLTARFIVVLGKEAIVVNQIIANISNFPFLFGNAFATVATTLAGIKYGEQNKRELRLEVSMTAGLSSLSGILLCLLLIILGRPLIGLYVSDPAIAEACYAILRVYAFVVPVQAVGNSLAGAFRGIGRTKWPAYSMLFGIAILRPIVAYVLAFPCSLGVSGMWYAIITDETIRCLFLLFAYRYIFGGLQFQKDETLQSAFK